MAHPKKLEFTALGGLFLQALFLLLAVLFAVRSQSAAVMSVAWYVGIGLLIWVLVLVHGRQRRLARQEREEMEELRQTRLSEEIFEETELDRMRASTGLLIFEKYLVPFLSVVYGGLLIYGAYRIVDAVWLAEEAAAVQIPQPVAMGMVAVGFMGLLMGKYAAGLAQSREFRLLRAAGGYMLGNVGAAVLTAVAMGLLSLFEFEWADRAVAYVIPVVMALVAVEVLANLVLDIYRPRVPGLERRPPYDSRLLGLMAEPEGVFRTVAATLDYQFGFKVSETWFYRFMERAILPLLMLQVVSLWLLTCFVVVDQDEIVFIEKFGQPYVGEQDAARGLPATVYEPGLYLKAPWPFAAARHVPAYRVESMEIGKVYEAAAGMPDVGLKVAAESDIILWTELHIDPREGQEVSFLVPSTVELEEEAGAAAGQSLQTVPAETEPRDAAAATERPPVNLARIQGHIHYRVRRKPDGTIDERAAFNYFYRETDIRHHLERLAYRAMCRIAASQDFISWVAQDRAPVVRRFERMLNEAIEREELGLEVLYAGIPSVHPPAEAAPAYEAVVTGLEHKETLTHEGEGQKLVTIHQAEGRAVVLENQAEGHAARLRESAAADRDLFLARLSAYEIAPAVYKHRLLFSALERALVGQKLFVVPVAPTEVEIIDLKEKPVFQVLGQE